MSAGVGTFTQNYSPLGTTATANGSIFTPLFTLDATDQTLSAININPNTNSNNDAGDILYAVNANNITGSSAVETALRVGSGWDNVMEIEGATNDGIETYFTATDPTASDKTINIPNASGTVAVSASGVIALDALGNITCPTCLASAGTLFTAAGSTGTNQTISQGDTLTIEAGTDITTVGTNTDRIVINDTSTLSTVTGRGATTTTLVNLDGGIAVDTSNFTVSGTTGAIATASTISLPNSNTLTGVSSYTQFNNGISVGGGTSYFLNSSGTLQAQLFQDQLDTQYGLDPAGNFFGGTSYSLKTQDGAWIAAGGVTAYGLLVGNGSVGIGDLTPDYKLEIGAAAASDSSFALSDADVAHGLTALGETDAWLSLKPISSTAGGTKLEAFSDTDAAALNIYGYMGSTDPTDTTAAIKLIGAKKNTTNVQDLGASETVFQLANNDNAPDFTLLGSGNIGIGTTTPSVQLSLYKSSYTSPQVILNDGAVAATSYPGGNTPQLVVRAPDGSSGSRPLLFGYDDGSTGWKGFLMAGACGSFDWMCMYMGTGNNKYLAFENKTTTLNIGGGDDTGFTDIDFKNDTNGHVSFDTNLLYLDGANNRVGIGNTAPTAGLTLNVTGNINTSTGYYYGGTGSPINLELSRTIPTTVSNTVEIGSFNLTNGAHNFRVSITNSDASFSVAKVYNSIPVKYDATANTWYTLIPSSDTGAYSGNDYTLDINVNATTATLRIRRTAGTTAGTAKVRIESLGDTTDTFTASTTTASGVAAPTVYYNQIYQAALGGVAIGTTDTSAGKFTVDGGATSGYGIYVSNIGSSGTAIRADGGSGNNGGYFANNNASGTGIHTIQSNASGYSVYAEGGKNYFQGNVGIGTTTPIGPLHISGNAYANEFVQWDSYFQEEFNKETSSAVTADGQLNWGDDLNWSYDITVGPGGSCSTDITDDTVNGISAQAVVGGSIGASACLTYTGTKNANDANKIFDADNKPVILVKAKPSNATSAFKTWVGISDQQTAAGTNPSNGLWFDNNGSNNAKWYGRACNGGTCSETSSDCGTISTTQYATMMIRVNSTSDVEFYIDTDASDGITMTKCGNTVTSNIPTAGLAGTIQNSSTTNGAGFTLNTDFFRVWSDDPPGGGDSQVVSAPSTFNRYSMADLAEAYSVDDPLNNPPGYIMSIVGGILTQKSTKPYDPAIIGITSNTQKITLGDQDTTTVPIALTGRVQTFVTTKNGAIHAGDPITSSDIAGVGMKATKAGTIIGRALESYDESDPTAIGKILVFINPSWSDPDSILTSTGDLQLDDHPTNTNNSSVIASQNYSVKDATGNIINRIGVFSEIMVAKINTGMITMGNGIVKGTLVAKNITVESLLAANASIDNLTVNILSANTKIASPIVEADKVTANNIDTNELSVAQKAQIAEIDANTIKPQDNTLTVDLQNTPNKDSQKLKEIIIKGLNNQKVASIDAAGNATFSGTLAAKDATISGQLAASEATISGTLSAREIRAGNIDSISNNLNNVQSNIEDQGSSIQHLSTNINDIQQLLNDIKNQPLPNAQYYQNLNPNGTYNIGTESAMLQGNFNSLTGSTLTVTDKATLYNAYVSNTLTAGLVSIENNEILALTSELKLSALTNINLLDGAVLVDRTGKITSRGAVVAQGGIETNSIKALHPEDDIKVKLGSINQNGQIKNSKLEIKNSEDHTVASVDASGSGRFKDIALNDTYLEATQAGAVIAADQNFDENGIFAPAIKTNSAAAGLGIIPAGKHEVIIYNSKVTNNSLIYVTPTSSTQNKSVYVGTKVAGNYFRVVIDQPIGTDVKFNWWIVN